MLNSVKWEYFKLEDLFEIKKYPNTISKKAERCISNNQKNTIAYVTRSVNNNGVKFFCNRDLLDKEEIKIFEENAIIIGGEATECFYIETPFITGNNVSILTNNHLNKFTGLFIVKIIDKEFYRYSYGRGFTMTRIKNTSIKLPIDSNGDPNWGFMEEYMKKISKGNLEGFNLPKNDTRLSLNDREWDDFKLEDLFEIERGRGGRVKKTTKNKKHTPFITSTAYNNGKAGYIEAPPTHKRGSITVARNGSTSTAFYQSKDFLSTEDVHVFYFKNNKYISRYIALFIIPLIEKEKYRYGYGRKFGMTRMKNTVIKLPIKPKSSKDEKSEPDWAFMENYIKGLQYTKKL